MKKTVKTIAILVMTACLTMSTAVFPVFAEFSQDKNGNTIYVDESGEAVTGLQKIDGTYYYFDKNGIMQTGTKIINNKYIYTFGNDGKFKKKANGWVKFTKATYYCVKGKIQKGIVTITDEYGNKGQYYFDEKGRLVTDKNVEYKLSTLYIGSDGEIYSIVDNTQEKRSEYKKLDESKEWYQDHIKTCEDVIKESQQGQKEAKEMIDYYKQKANSGSTRMVYGSNGSVSYAKDTSQSSYYLVYADRYQEIYDEYEDVIKEAQNRIKEDKAEIQKIDKQLKELETQFKEADVSI